MRKLQRAHAAGALSLYVAFSFLAFGLRPLLHPGPDYIGVGEDPQIFIWSFAWWPHAILNGINPFVTHAVWAPEGVNLTWATSVPGLALLFAPLTLTIGAFAAYNVAAVLMPALAAWTAFLLCRKLAGGFWPSLFGGYLFGFSSYILGHEEGHLHVTSVFLIPLVALVAVRFLTDELSGGAAAVRFVPLFAGQVLFSTEVAFTLAVALVYAFGVALAALPARRARLVALVQPVAVAAAGAAAIIAPFLFFAATSIQSGSISSPEDYPADLLNLIVPTRLSLISSGWTSGVADHFPGNNAERGAYLGIPLLIMIVLYVRRNMRRPSTWALLAALGLTTTAALGPTLTVNGHKVIALPSRLTSALPFFNNVLPGRLMVYATLTTAIVAALWLSRQRHGLLRVVLPILTVAAIAPNPRADAYFEGYSVPAFFTDPLYRTCLDRGERILPLPISSGGVPMLWQVAADFRFDMSGGRILPGPPAAFLTSEPVAEVSRGHSIAAENSAQLQAFIEEKHVTSVVVDLNLAPQWSAALDRIASGHAYGGVLLYHVSGASPSCLG